MQALTTSNPLWREFLGDRMGLERRYGQLLHTYEKAFAGYFGGFVPIDFRPRSSNAMDPDIVVRIVLTMAELSMSESSESSESPSTDEDNALNTLRWEDAQEKKPRWALLSDTYAAATVSSKTSPGNPLTRFSSPKQSYGNDPILLHTEGVSDHQLSDQIYEAKNNGCIGIIVEIVENQYNGRVMDPETLRRLGAICAKEHLLLVVDETLTAIRCGAPFSFQREEYLGVASPDLVFFGKAIGAQGTAVNFDGQFIKKLGILGSSRGRAIRNWQRQFQKPLPTADLIQAMATIDMAVGGNLTMLSRINGQAIRVFVLERAKEQGHEINPPDVLGGLESLIFVRKDIAGEMLVITTGASGVASVPVKRRCPLKL
ncbi:hypothetical protein CCHL11_02743 [Colletotrichum chlorophyti]|uniref:Uncharacterized protein n=1 Tax=Colletotrichum chlorophyti TaxID=708187 RepID=A0A1Q8S315_9PEZI|nr:hypothetical protein CCHL11_02743 [Colletotrichum chlorophyti]